MRSTSGRSRCTTSATLRICRRNTSSTSGAASCAASWPAAGRLSEALNVAKRTTVPLWAGWAGAAAAVASATAAAATQGRSFISTSLLDDREPETSYRESRRAKPPAGGDPVSKWRRSGDRSPAGLLGVRPGRRRIGGREGLLRGLVDGVVLGRVLLVRREELLLVTAFRFRGLTHRASLARSGGAAVSCGCAHVAPGGSGGGDRG